MVYYKKFEIKHSSVQKKDILRLNESLNFYGKCLCVYS